MSDLTDRAVVLIPIEAMMKVDLLLRLKPEDWGVDNLYATRIMLARQELGLSLHKESSIRDS